jgi:hypothetical protein
VYSAAAPLRIHNKDKQNTNTTQQSKKMSNTDPTNQPKVVAKGYAVCSIFLASTCTTPLATNFPLTDIYCRIPVSTSSLIHTFIYFEWATHLFCLMAGYCIIQFVILISNDGAQLIVD